MAKSKPSKLTADDLRSVARMYETRARAFRAYLADHHFSCYSTLACEWEVMAATLNGLANQRTPRKRIHRPAIRAKKKAKARKGQSENRAFTTLHGA